MHRPAEKSGTLFLPPSWSVSEAYPLIFGRHKWSYLQVLAWSQFVYHWCLWFLVARESGKQSSRTLWTSDWDRLPPLLAPPPQDTLKCCGQGETGFTSGICSLVSENSYHPIAVICARGRNATQRENNCNTHTHSHLSAHALVAAAQHSSRPYQLAYQFLNLAISSQLFKMQGLSYN